MRAGDGFGWMRLDSDFTGRGFAPGAGFDAALASMADGVDETFAGALLRKVRGALLRESVGSTLSGQADVRRTGDVLAVVIPQAK